MSRHIDASSEFLRREYVDNGKTTTQIADEVGCHRTTIIKRLSRFGIPARRGGSPSNHIDVSDNLLEILDGSLLGDGSMGTQHRTSAYYTLGQKHRKYIEFMASYFKSLDVPCGNIYKRYRVNDSGTISNLFSFKTADCVELLEQLDRWYPRGIKIVPKDVRLTPLAMRTWFLEDGSFYTKGGCTLGTIRLHTNWFTEEDVRMLIDRLKILLNTPRINFRLSKGKYPEIQFGHKDAVQKFFDYIGPFPKELYKDYGYKMLDNRDFIEKEAN